MGHGRLGVVELLRGRGDRAVARDGVEHAQAGDVEHASTLSMDHPEGLHGGCGSPAGPSNHRGQAGGTGSGWERRAWAAGIVFVVALLAEAVISAGIPINQDDSAAKIAAALDDHRTTVLVAGYLSTVYA